MNETSTKDLEKVIGSASHRIFDVRPVDAYNSGKGPPGSNGGRYAIYTISNSWFTLVDYIGRS